MQFQIKTKLQRNFHSILRDIGYKLHPKYADSYIRNLSPRAHYPRWHLYVQEKSGIFKFKLHLDQKQASYAQQKAHSGEDNSSVVQKEVLRIIQLFKKYNQ